MKSIEIDPNPVNEDEPKMSLDEFFKWKDQVFSEITGTVGDTLNLNHSTDTFSTALLILILILWIRWGALHLFQN